MYTIVLKTCMLQFIHNMFLCIVYVFIKTATRSLESSKLVQYDLRLYIMTLQHARSLARFSYRMCMPVDHIMHTKIRDLFDRSILVQLHRSGCISRQRSYARRNSAPTRERSMLLATVSVWIPFLTRRGRGAHWNQAQHHRVERNQRPVSKIRQTICGT